MCHELSSFFTEEYYNLTYIKINTINGIHIYVITSNTISLCKMLHHINIRNFRNLEHFETDFNQGITALIGKNGSGKSSLIEAIYFLSIGRSFRATHDRDTINKKIIGTGDFTSIKANVSINQNLNEIQMILDLNNSNRLKKNCSYNGATLPLSKLIGNLKSVCFSVNDMNIIYGSPSIRRKYINILNLQLDNQYVSELLVYSKIVESRNSLLKQIKNNFSSKVELEYWNNKMVESGTYLIISRYKTINQLSALAESIYPKLFNNYHSKVPFVRNLSQGLQDFGTRTQLIYTLEDRFCRFNKWEPRDKKWNNKKRMFTITRKEGEEWIEKAVPILTREEAEKDYHSERAKSIEASDPQLLEFEGRYQPAFTYKALNKLIQGSAADTIKKAMVLLFKAGIIPQIQIHDELCISIKSKEEAVKVKNIMENAVRLAVPNKVDYEAGENWGNIN